MVVSEYYINESGKIAGPYALRTLQNRLGMMTMVCPAGKINDPEWVTLGEALEEHGLSATMESLLPQRKDQFPGLIIFCLLYFWEVWRFIIITPVIEGRQRFSW